MQLTSLSLQIQVVNVIAEVLQLLVLRPVWDTEGYWAHSIFNMAAPMASYRLMVPFALPLNGLLRFNDRGYTIGSVIWVRGDKWGDLADASLRTLVRCPEASTFTAHTAEAAADIFRARNPNAVLTGSVAASNLDRVGGLAVTAPPGAAVGDVLGVGDWVSVGKPGAAADELRAVTDVTASGIRVGPDLPGGLGGEAVELRRLDPAVVRLGQVGAPPDRPATTIARTVTFIRGEVVHFAHQLPAGVLTGGSVEVTEHLPAGRRQEGTGTLPVEHPVIRLADAADLSGFSVGDVVRIRSGGSSFARTVAEVRAPVELRLDEPLPVGAHTGLEVARLVPSTDPPVTGQTATGTRLTIGALPDLARFDGLLVQAPGAGGALEARHVVVQVLADLVVEPVPPSLHGVPVEVESLDVDVSTQATGTVGSPTRLDLAAGAERFPADSAVLVTAATGEPAAAGVASVDAGGQLTLADPLPAALGAGTAVTVTRLAPVAAATFPAEPIAAPGDHVVATVPDGSALGAGGALRIRGRGTTGGGAVRRLTAAPGLLAELDRPIPNTHATNITVTRLAPDPAAIRAGPPRPSSGSGSSSRPARCPTPSASSCTSSPSAPVGRRRSWRWPPSTAGPSSCGSQSTPRSRPR